MTNPTTESLLARYAKCAERLKGTGAPGVPEWCDIFHSRIEGQGFAPNEGGECCEVDDADVTNPQACLAGCVMWAMEVSSHPTATDVVDSNVVFKKSVGMWLGCYSFEGQDDYRRFTTKEEAWCFVLESIADAIGGE